MQAETKQRLQKLMNDQFKVQIDKFDAYKSIVSLKGTKEVIDESKLRSLVH